MYLIHKYLWTEYNTFQIFHFLVIYEGKQSQGFNSLTKSNFVSLTFQVNVFQHATFSVSGQGKTELTFLRMAVTNSVIDPWLYILFRKENLVILVNFGNRLLGRNNSPRPSDTSRSRDSQKTNNKTIKTVSTMQDVELRI